MGACLSRKKAVKFKGKSKPEPVVGADRPINGISEAVDRIANSEDGPNGYKSKAAVRHQSLSGLSTSSHPKHVGNGDLSRHITATEDHTDDSDDEEFFDALSEWPSELESDKESSKVDGCGTSSELDSRHAPCVQSDAVHRENSRNSEGTEHPMQEKHSSGHRHSKQGQRERTGLFSVCLSLVHKPEDSDDSKGTDPDRHDMVSKGKKSTSHVTTLPSPSAPKDHQVAGDTMTRAQDESLEGCNSWCRISPSHFNLRSDTYLKNRKKQKAVGSVYDVLTCDVFVSEKKLRHVARALRLPSVKPKSADIQIPQFLIVNTMVPLYDHSFWGSSNQTNGYNAFFVCVLNEEEYRNLSPGTRSMLHECMKEPAQRTEGNRTEARDRMKAIPMLRNPQDIKFSLPERRLIEGYNAKPVMARPQVEFYLGDNYFEVDLDIHRFGTLCRRALTFFRERMANMILDFSFVLQGMKAEELPEKVLMSARLLRVDYGAQKQWPWPGSCIEDDYQTEP